jgi:hypothetical protein
MQCRLIRDMTGDADAEFPTGVRPAGTILASPPHRDTHIVLLVQMGCAEPADEECAKASGMTPERMEAAQHAYERISIGIHPDDYELFDAGLIAGYRPDGSYIPGPNAEPEEDQEPESALWIPEGFDNG